MKSTRLKLIGLALALVFIAQTPAVVQKNNPFFTPYQTPFNVPPFALIKNDHFLPAIQEGIRRQQSEIDAICKNRQAPTFENTIAALDSSGIFLAEVSAVYGALQAADTNPQLQALAKETAPLLAAHRDNITLNEKLFQRIRAVYEKRANLQLTQEQLFLLENTYRDFVRGGALLASRQKERLRELNRELALLSVQFGENLLAETNDFKLVAENQDDLAGLPPALTAAAAAAANQLGMPGKWVFTLQGPSIIPFLQYSSRRDLREKLYRAYFSRGDHGNDRDNKRIVSKIAVLRCERAALLGYPTYAHFVLVENMAKTTEAVNLFLKKLWDPALVRAKKELAQMQAIADREGAAFKLAAWDWWYYAEKLRQQKYDLDDAALRPYFSLENVRSGIFTLCNKLYGLTFTERPELPRYHSEVQAFEVCEAGNRHVGILYMDFHPRPGKRVGAWSGAFRREFYRQRKRVAPVSTIVCNFTRPTSDAPSLLSKDEVETFFHEFGHSLATLLSESRYRNRSVARDAGELPSQIMENWAMAPELLNLYARHYQTGEVIPAALVEKIRNSSLFNQGFVTVEYLAACFLDMAWHSIGIPWDIDVTTFENATLGCVGLIPEIVSRYRSTYFNHIFNGGYMAGYYNYIWAEVLDADAFEAFKEKGLFDQATALSFRKNILEHFGNDDIQKQYLRFRGAEPKIGPLLKRRGLDETQTRD